MPDPVTGIIGGSALLGAGSSIYGANKQSKATRRAADSTLQGTRESLNFQREGRDMALDQLQPYTDAAPQSLADLQGLAGRRTLGGEQGYLNQMAGMNPNIDMEFDPNDPLYQEQMGELSRMLNARRAAMGSSNSSGAEFALTRAALPLMEQSVQRNYQQDVGNYNRGASQAGTLFNMENTLSGQQYGRTNDLAQLLYNARQSAGNASIGAGSNMGQTAQSGAAQYGNVMMQQGQNDAANYSALGQAPMNALSTYAMMGGNFGGGQTVPNYTPGQTVGSNPFLIRG